jgi:hypothetical protein
LPSENLQVALAGGLGRFDLSSDMAICAEARVAAAQSKTAMETNFFIIFPPGIALNVQQLAISQDISKTCSALHTAESNPFAWTRLFQLTARCYLLFFASPRIIRTSSLQSLHGRI